MDEQPHKGTLRVIRRITADRVLERAEVWDLGNYLNECREARHSWPGTILWETLKSIFEDSVVTDEELEALGQMLSDIENECASISDLGLTTYIRTASRAELEAARKQKADPFKVPQPDDVPHRQTDAGEEFETSLVGPTCNCAEWKKKRSDLPSGHPGRICQHIARTYSELLEQGKGGDWSPPFVGMVKDLAEMFRGSDMAPTWLEIDVEDSKFLIAMGDGEWTHVHGPSQTEEYDRFSYRAKDRSWFFGERPKDDTFLSTVIDALLDDSGK